MGGGGWHRYEEEDAINLAKVIILGEDITGILVLDGAEIVYLFLFFKLFCLTCKRSNHILLSKVK